MALCPLRTHKNIADVAERQTRCVQVAVSSRGCRFKSYRRHQYFEIENLSRASGTGFFLLAPLADGIRQALRRDVEKIFGLQTANRNLMFPEFRSSAELQAELGDAMPLFSCYVFENDPVRCPVRFCQEPAEILLLLSFGGDFLFAVLHYIWNNCGL